MKYDYHENINTLLKEIILSNFKYIQENIDGKKRELSAQIVNLTNRLSSAREKYLEDRLDFEDYQIIKNESKKKFDELEMELQNQRLSRKNTDIGAKLDQVLKTSCQTFLNCTLKVIMRQKILYCVRFWPKKLNFKKMLFEHPN